MCIIYPFNCQAKVLFVTVRYPAKINVLASFPAFHPTKKYIKKIRILTDEALDHL